MTHSKCTISPVLAFCISAYGIISIANYILRVSVKWWYTEHVCLRHDLGPAWSMRHRLSDAITDLRMQ